MFYPGFPQAGDLIGICAPSAGVGYKLESFDSSIENLKERGFAVRETDSVRHDDIRSNYPTIRGSEFNSLISDKDVKAIIAATGGGFNIEVLPYVDWKAIKKNPKWVAGFSDPTNLTYTITTMLDIATIYGFNAGSFAGNPLHAFQTNALSILQGDLMRQDSFDKYIGTMDYESEPVYDTDVRWDIYVPRVAEKPDQPFKDFQAADEITVSGRLIGGCLDVIDNIVGTPYDYTEKFLDKYDDLIWFFDVFSMDADELYIALLRMKYNSFFENAKAIVIGRIADSKGSTDAEFISNIARCIDIPVILNADIGHVKPCMTLITGSLGTFTVKNGKAELLMKLD